MATVGIIDLLRYTLAALVTLVYAVYMASTVYHGGRALSAVLRRRETAEYSRKTLTGAIILGAILTAAWAVLVIILLSPELGLPLGGG
ncbi:MAG: hypothetical protein F7C35_01990 [Desulfurococcales archaeon]|nr:hypothetical protein [Desulfurococcales archaeon]